VLWTRKSSEHGGREREEEEAEEKAEPQTCARRAALKGTGLTPHLRCWARRVSKTPAHSSVRPGKQPPTHVTPQSSWGTDAQRPRTVMMALSRPSHRPRCSHPLLHPHRHDGSNRYDRPPRLQQL
jgi:hypothetical protein